MKAKLTQKMIRELEPPKSGRLYVYDTVTPGLAVCVTKAGSKTWYRCGRVGGRPQRLRLSPVQSMGIDAARDTVREMNAEIVRGRDLGKTRRHKARTFGQLWEWYRENHSKPHKKTWQRDVARYDSYLCQWSRKSLVSITRADVAELHATMRERVGPFGANDCMEQIRHMLGKAVELGWLENNAAAGIARFPEPSRERFLSPDEMQRFFAALQNLKRETTRDFLLVALFTGARRDNVQCMRWEEIAFDRSVWTIPGHKFKNGRPHTIPLSVPAVEVLRRRHDNRDPDIPWVFPGGGKTGHLVDPKAAWQKVCKEANLHDLRIHDLRRTLGSWQAAAGTSVEIIGKTLGHRPGSAATHVYARLTLDPVRESVEAATQAILKAAEQQEKK